MPIYEYYCKDCQKRVNVFFRTMSTASDDAARCPNCNGANLQRLVSRIRVLKSEADRLESLDDPAMLSALESEDPRAIAGFMRKMSAETDSPPDAEMNEVIDRLEAGESPEAIEKSLPGLASDVGNGFDNAD